MYKLAVLTLALTLTGPVAAAETKYDPDKLAKTIAPYLDDEVIAVAHMDLSRVEVAALYEQLGKWDKGDGAGLEASKGLMKELVATLTKAKAQDVYAVFSLADVNLRVPAQTPFLIVPLQEDADSKAIALLFSKCGLHTARMAEGRVLFAGAKGVLKRLQGLTPKPRPELAMAFAAAGDSAVQLVFVPTADMRRVVEEMIPRLPREVGGVPGTVLSRGLLWAAVGLEAPPQLSAKLTIQAQDPESAKGMRALIGNLLKLAGKHEQVRELLPDFDKLAEALMPQVQDNRLILKDKGKVLAPLATALVDGTRRAAQKAQTSKNLQQIGIAMHSYLDHHKAFPMAATYDKQGKPLLSWRVQLLPFLGEDKLYKEFRLDEPWDSAHNKKLIDRIPKIFAPAGKGKLAAMGKTTFLAPLGEATMFPGRKALKISDVTDGTANTIFIVEAVDAQAVIWTKPEDLKFDPKKPMAGLVSKGMKGFWAVYVDASVRFVPAKTSDDTMRSLFTRAGGEVLGEDAP